MAKYHVEISKVEETNFSITVTAGSRDDAEHMAMQYFENHKDDFKEKVHKTIISSYKE